MTAMRPPDEILAERVVLVALTQAHAEEMFALIDGDRERLTRTQTFFQKIQTVEDERADLQRKEEARAEGNVFAYAIALRPQDGSRQLIGGCGVFSISQEHERCELGYWLAGAFEGQGLVTETVGALEKACFETGFHRIEIRCGANNPRSAGIPKRLGYQLDGRRREAWLLHGERHDGLIFSKLRTDSR